MRFLAQKVRSRISFSESPPFRTQESSGYPSLAGAFFIGAVLLLKSLKVPFFSAPLLRREVGGKMIIEIREGNKTKIKIVPDNWTPSDDLEQKDLTTSGRKSIGYSDIPEEKWNRIFNHFTDEER